MAAKKPAQLSSTIRKVVAVFHDADAMENAVQELAINGMHSALINLMSTDTAVQDRLSHVYERVERMTNQLPVPRTVFRPRVFDATQARSRKARRGEILGAVLGDLSYAGAISTRGLVVSSGGVLAALIVLAMTGLGDGFKIGDWLKSIIGDDSARKLSGELDNKGMLVWVRATDVDTENRVLRILQAHGGAQVQVHDIILPVWRGENPAGSAMVQG